MGLTGDRPNGAEANQAKDSFGDGRQKKMMEIITNAISMTGRARSSKRLSQVGTVAVPLLTADHSQTAIALAITSSILPTTPRTTLPMARRTRTPLRAPPIAKLCRAAKRLLEATLPTPDWNEAALEPAYMACEYVGTIRREAACPSLNRAYLRQAQWR